MKLNKSKYILMFLTVLITFVIAFALPTFGQVTPFGMKVIAVFVGTMFAWIAVDLTWGTIYGFAMIALFSLMPAVQALSSGLGNQQVVMVCISMAFAMATNQMGVTDIIANTVLKQKVINSNPWLLVFGILAVCYVVSSIGPVMAVIFLMWALVFKICDKAGYEKKDKFVTFMIFMITSTSFLAAMVFPFRGNAIMYMAYLKQVVPDLTFSTGWFIVCSFSITASIVFLTALFGKYVLKVDASKFVLPQEEINRLNSIKATKKEKIGIVILVIYILVLTLPEFIQFPGSALLKTLGVVGVGCFALLIPALLKFDGKPMIDVGKAIQGVDWPLLFLLAVTFPLADLLRHADAGIMPTIVAFVKPIVDGMGVTTFVIVITVILGLLTQVTHNLVLGAMFMPFVCPLVAEMGGSLFGSWFMIYVVLNCAYVTPAGSACSAMIFGNERSDTKTCYALGAGLLICALLVVIVAYPLISKVM